MKLSRPNPPRRENRSPRRCVAAPGGCALGWSLGLALTLTTPAADFSAWEHRQDVRVATPGLIKLNLPIDTLDAARAGLEDLRLLDPGGSELPYLLEHSARAERATRLAKTFEAVLEPSATRLTLETGLARSIDAVTLETPAASFIKPVRIEGSSDGANWQSLAQGLPIFRQPSGASQLQLPVPKGTWPFLRLTVDDRGSPPVPFTGARVHAASPEAVPGEPIPIEIVGRHETATQTRLMLKLGAAHLTLADLTVETAEPLFTRPATLAARQLAENMLREQPLARGTLYRVLVEGQPASASLTLVVGALVPSRELVLLIDNGSSPPLNITSIRATRRPVYLLFPAKQAGTHSVLTGNRLAAIPRYDLAALSVNLKGVAVSSLELSAVAPNPAFHPPETLPQIQDRGRALDVSAWEYRKRVQLTGRGVQQIELDPDVLSHAGSSFQDLRLMRNGEQLPYLIEHTSLPRVLQPVVLPADDPKRSRVSRWSLQLPHRSLPLEGLSVVTRTPLFERQVVLYEEVPDERGAKYQRPLGQTRWVRTPDRTENRLLLTLSSPPVSDRLLLETDNGDNPAIDLHGFQFSYPVTRLLFKVTEPADLFLYYGNRKAGPPRYDLALVAEQFLAAEKSVATPGPEEQLKGGSWVEGPSLAGVRGILFWGVLGLVVVTLLVVISRLLPKGVLPKGVD